MRVRTDDIASPMGAENLLKIILDLSPGLIAISEPETGRHIDVNETWLRVLGYDRDEVVGHTVEEFGLWADMENRADMVREMLATGSISNFEAHFLRKDRESCFVLVSGVTVDIGGAPRFLLIGQDITAEKIAKEALEHANDALELTVAERTEQLLDKIEEYKAIQKALADNEEKFRTFAEASSDWYWETDEWHRFTWVSADISRFTKQVGTPPPIGSTRWEALWAVADEETWAAHRAELDARVPFRDCVYKIVGDKGAEVWVSTSGSPYFDDDGRFRGYRGTGRDVTARITAQQELEAAHRQTTMEKLFSEAVISSISDGIITLDAQGRIETFNQAAQDIFGFDADEVLGRETSILLPEVVRDEHERYTRAPEAYIDRINNVERELMGRRRSGELFPLSLTVSPITLGEGGKYVAVVRDIGERKAYESKLKATMEEAEKANMAKSEFLSSMSHELRTPLNAIIGFSQLLAMDKETLSGDQLENVQQIIRGGHHLLDLINDVLDLAKIESGTVALAVEDVKVTELFDSAITLIGGMAAKRRIRVCDETAGSEGIVLRADGLRAKQVLLNLMSNAVKYNREGGTLTLAAETTDGGMLRVSVSDTGLGIPADRHDEVFLAFARLNAERTGVEGTGIGLSIAERLVAMMGGDMGFESREGEGSTFWFELPLADGASAARQADDPRPGTPSGNRAADSVTNDRYTMLYVEDNVANREFLRHLVKHLGNINLELAPTAEIGIRMVEEAQPDVILMDIMLPGMDGFQALAHLRAEEKTRNIPIIALSANAMPGDRERGMAAGFDMYLTKPVVVADLTAALDKVLGRACA